MNTDVLLKIMIGWDIGVLIGIIASLIFIMIIRRIL